MRTEIQGALRGTAVAFELPQYSRHLTRSLSQYGQCALSEKQASCNGFTELRYSTGGGLCFQTI